MNMTTAPVDEPLPTGRLAAPGLQRGQAAAPALPVSGA